MPGIIRARGDGGFGHQWPLFNRVLYPKEGQKDFTESLLVIWITLKGDIMDNTDKQRDLLPETFASEEEAGEF